MTATIDISSFDASGGAPMRAGRVVAAQRSASARPEEPAPGSGGPANAEATRPGFDEVYDAHFDFVWRSLELLGVDDHALEDAAQDTFSVVSRQLASFEGRSALKTWLFAILQRVASNYRRKRRRKQAPLTSLEESAGDEPTPLAHVEAAEAARSIEAFCAALPPERRALFVLAVLEELPAAEVAATLSVPTAKVYSRVHSSSSASFPPKAGALPAKKCLGVDTERAKEKPHMSLSIGSPTRSISGSVRMRRTLARNRLRSARHILASLALGCSSQGVDLGGSVATQSLQRGARCQVSPILEGNVLVTNQEELEELEGCEQILGDLTVRLFAGADLSALHALRVVDSSLLLGQTLFAEPSDDQSFDETEQLEAALRGTWLTSLTGLQSLERVGALAVMHTAVPDLTPLERLRQIGGATRQSQTFLSSGDLGILGNPALRDLRGLEQVRGTTELEVSFNGALESLAGLTLGPELTSLSLFEEPALTDIDALATVTRLGSLTLNSVGVTDLDAFSAVFQVDDAVTIEFNPNLVDATGLGNIRKTRSLVFAENAMLKNLPSLQSYSVPPESVVIIDNPELEELVFDFSQASTLGFFAGGRPLSFSIDGILISDNAKLRSVAFPPSPIEQLGVSSVQALALELNPSLTEIDFGALASVDQLVIDQNPVLANVTLGELSTVDMLQLTNNPSLDASVFDPVRTFERIE